MRAFGKLDQRAGGEDLMVLGTHMLDLMRFFAGEARWVDARVTQGDRDAVPGEVRRVGDGVGLVLGDGVTATYGFDRGVTGTFHSFPAARGGGSDYFRLELCGTDGLLSFRSGPLQELFQCAEPLPLPGKPAWQRVEVPAPPPDGADSMHPANQALVRDLLEAVEKRREALSSLKDGRAAVEMIMAVYVSHLRKGRVTLPLEQRKHPLDAYAPKT